MSSEDLADFFVHQVLVQTYLGRTGSGADTYADPVPVTGFLTRKRRYIRDDAGETVISESSYSTDIDQLAVLTPKSLVILNTDGLPFGAGTFGSGTFSGVTGPTTVVMSVQVSTGGDFIEGIDRVKAFLQ